MYLFDRAEAEIRIAKNAAVLIDRLAGDHTFTLNLGNGIPSRITDFIENENVFIQAENGFLGVGPIAKEEEADWNLINANRQPVKETPGCSFFASEDAFGMMRGGHIDATALGAFSVDSDASISNWIIPTGMQLGVGGAMDVGRNQQFHELLLRRVDKWLLANKGWAYLPKGSSPCCVRATIPQRASVEKRGHGRGQDH